MKTAEIAQKYGIDHLEFDRFLVATRVEYHTSLSGEKVIKDNKLEDLIKKFNTYCIEKAQLEEQKELEAKRQAEYKTELAKALPKMLITSGFSFEGYRIVKYSGYISGDDAIQIEQTVQLLKLKRLRMMKRKSIEKEFAISANSIFFFIPFQAFPSAFSFPELRLLPLPCGRYLPRGLRRKEFRGGNRLFSEPDSVHP